MREIIEAIPNISEAKREDVLEKILAPLREVEKLCLLDVKPDKSHNRTVMTMIGEREVLLEAGLLLYRKAVELIDMRNHKGEHPRVGAIDVFPFVPIKNVTMEDCVELSRKLGEKVWAEFKIPVYYYEESATRDERRNLPDIRKGEFEGFFEKIKDPKWYPDVGEPVVHTTAGVTIIGARMPLIAYNINLGTSSIDIANKIAKAIRHISGGLRYVRAIGVMLEDRNIAQVSINMTNYKKTPLFRVMEMVKSEAERYGVQVIGSEIVGLVPEEALIDVADFYLRLENFSYDQLLERKIEKALEEKGI
ncbi:MAG: glutamate formimidoyltransferase [Candidatus Aminicenantia bacterium]